MNTRKFQKTLESILRDDSRYAAGAYIFVRMALDFTVKRLCALNPSRRERHVSSGELLEGIRLFAIETFGPMALPLFHEWGVYACMDFGQIVFNLVDAKALSKTEDDRLEDFADGYDFEEAFAAPFLPKKKEF